MIFITVFFIDDQGPPFDMLYHHTAGECITIKVQGDHYLQRTPYIPTVERYNGFCQYHRTIFFAHTAVLHFHFIAGPGIGFFHPITIEQYTHFHS